HVKLSGGRRARWLVVHPAAEVVDGDHYARAGVAQHRRAAPEPDPDLDHDWAAGCAIVEPFQLRRVHPPLDALRRPYRLLACPHLAASNPCANAAFAAAASSSPRLRN